MQVKKIAHVAYNTTGHKYCPSIFTGAEVAKSHFTTIAGRDRRMDSLAITYTV